MHCRLHPRVRFTDTLWRLCLQAPSEQPWEVAAWVRGAMGNPGQAPRWEYGINLVTRADVIHLVGGGYVNGVWPRHIGLMAGAVEAACRSGGRLAMTGLGLFPVGRHAAALVQSLVGKFDVVDVRDDASAALVGVETGVDDAFLALGPHRTVADDLPDIVPCLQSDLVVGGNARLAAAVLAILRSWQVDSEHIGIVEGIPGVDRSVYELFEHELPGACFYPFIDIWTNGLPVSAGQTWLSTRFHYHLVAAAAGASGLAISVNPEYYTVKHGALCGLGPGWALVEDFDSVLAGNVPEPPKEGGFDPETVAKFRHAKEELAGRIYPSAARSGWSGTNPNRENAVSSWRALRGIRRGVPRRRAKAHVPLQ